MEIDWLDETERVDRSLAMSGLNVSASAPGILPPPDPGEEQQAAGLGILLQISMLILSFLVGHLLRRRKFYYLPEASVSLLIGNGLRTKTGCIHLRFAFQSPFSGRYQVLSLA